MTPNGVTLYLKSLPFPCSLRLFLRMVEKDPSEMSHAEWLMARYFGKIFPKPAQTKEYEWMLQKLYAKDLLTTQPDYENFSPIEIDWAAFSKNIDQIIEKIDREGYVAAYKDYSKHPTQKIYRVSKEQWKEHKAKLMKDFGFISYPTLLLPSVHMLLPFPFPF